MKKIASYEIIFLAFFLFFMWLVFGDFYLLIWSVVLLNLHNIIFSLIDIRERIYFLIFNLTVFLFLLSRPFIDMIYEYDLYAYDEQTGSLALLLIGCSLLSLFIGVLINEFYSKGKQYKILEFDRLGKSSFIENMRIISLWMYCICIIFDYMMGLEKIIFSQTHTYVEYYTTFKTRLPFIVRGISAMMPISLVIYLAMMPSKNRTIKVLVLYILSTIPDLIVGKRGPISKALLFSFLYFFLRDTLNQKMFERYEIKSNEWITKTLKKIMVISIPIIMIFFSSYNYMRFGTQKATDMNPIIDFIYSQGISFTAITRGYAELENLPNYADKNYTFGPFIDYIKRGTPSQILLGVEGFGVSNSVFRATEGHSFSHALSYHLYGNRYLKGRGLGSSYIIELYIDYGFIGVALFSLLLGIMFSSVNKAIGKNWIRDVIVLTLLMDVFLIPRRSALSWLLILITPQFWLLIMFCWFATKFLMHEHTKTIIDFNHKNIKDIKEL